jgi:hypothetical protein
VPIKYPTPVHIATANATNPAIWIGVIQSLPGRVLALRPRAVGLLSGRMVSLSILITVEDSTRLSKELDDA